MGFEVAYDPGQNIKIVKAIKKHPLLYKKCSYETKGLQDRAWASVAAELGVSEGYVKNRWVNIKGCFKRYLKNKLRSSTTKTYYLAEFLDFMIPYMNVPGVTCPEIECDDEVDIDEEFGINSDGEEEGFFISTNSNYSEETLIDEGNADWEFFSSLLPDVRRMNDEQKSKFRNAILLAIDTALYGEDF